MIVCAMFMSAVIVFAVHVALVRLRCGQGTRRHQLHLALRARCWP